MPIKPKRKSRAGQPRSASMAATQAAYYLAHRTQILTAMAVERKENPAKFKAKKASYYEANRELVIAKSRAWRIANTEKAKANDARRYAVDPERSWRSSALWRKENPERARASSAAWRAANAERVKLVISAWHAAHPEAKRLYKATRRSRKTSAGGIHDRSDIKALMLLQGGKCPVCRGDLNLGYHVDHIYPLAIGGRNDKENIQLLCATCNISKGAKDPIHFMQTRGFLL